MTAAPLIEARDLHTYYDESHILRGVSLVLKPGEALGLMGRNGMGKTTLIRTIMGLVRPRSGSVSVDGSDVTRDPAFRIAQRGIAYVPEGRGIFGSLSVRENLAIAERPGIDGKNAWTTARVLALFPRLGQRLHNGGDQLSGGEQQMLAIGRALMLNPKLLIMDEPSEGLAPTVIEILVETFRKLEQEGLRILLIEQNLGVATALAERQLVMVGGEIATETTATKLADDPELQRRYLGVEPVAH